jgi:hypothetical protein
VYIVKFFSVLALASFVGFQASGCAVPNTTHLPGSLMLDVGHEGWVVAEDGKVASTKSGKGTQESILGWVTSGDASFEAARKNGELVRISHMDYHASHILGIIGECSVICYGE